MRALACSDNCDRKKIEAVRAARIDRQFRAIARGDVTRVHEERIVEQAVARADGKQRGRETFQIGVERRDVRMARCPSRRAGTRRMNFSMSIVRSTSRSLPNSFWLGVIERSNAP